MDSSNSILGTVDNPKFPWLEDNSWLDEKIDKLDKANWLYKICTFFTFRKKWTFGEMYLFLVNLNTSKLGLEEAKKKAFMRVLDIYKFQNNKYPGKIDELIND